MAQFQKLFGLDAKTTRLLAEALGEQTCSLHVPETQGERESLRNPNIFFMGLPTVTQLPLSRP